VVHTAAAAASSPPVPSALPCAHAERSENNGGGCRTPWPWAMAGEVRWKVVVDAFLVNTHEH
jgi:hypothetical protein